MAKRFGVLEADEPLSLEPRRHVSKSVAKMLVRKLLAVPVGPRLIQMRKIVEETTRTIIRIFHNGPLGIGNLIPFSKPHSDGSRLHYEIPQAGDRSLLARHRRKPLSVSARNQIWPASGPQFRFA